MSLSDAKKRLLSDFKHLQEDPPGGITGAPNEDDIYSWQAVICGPEDTPWEGGTFPLKLQFPEDYPNHPPKVQFLTKVFHPNVYADGRLCLDILQEQWSPVYDVSGILTSIQSLLCDPNPRSPANLEAARYFTENKAEYYKRVLQSVESSWEFEPLD
eukprot:TRINITY_DN13081_c0_g1_i2.p1 TRINITY_DN13081_c0_g1~~TRINITY_DN13081_c0_g1_i2.p1  ORF type:complete len:175 (+),score=49.03 TRINITY_DN13081_c0_g1_i2:55-525(+)